MSTKEGVEMKQMDKDQLAKEMDTTLRNYDDEVEAPPLPKEEHALVDDSGFYEVPFCPCLSYGYCEA
jgi:hypothetical protein